MSPWWLWLWLPKRARLKLRDMEVRHAKERAELTAWIVEVEHNLARRMGEKIIRPRENNS